MKSIRQKWFVYYYAALALALYLANAVGVNFTKNKKSVGEFHEFDLDSFEENNKKMDHNSVTCLK